MTQITFEIRESPEGSVPCFKIGADGFELATCYHEDEANATIDRLKEVFSKYDITLKKSVELKEQLEEAEKEDVSDQTIFALLSKIKKQERVEGFLEHVRPVLLALGYTVIPITTYQFRISRAIMDNNSGYVDYYPQKQKAFIHIINVTPYWLDIQLTQIVKQLEKYI